MGTIQKIVITTIGSVAPLQGMEICKQTTDTKKPCILAWDSKTMLGQIQKATPADLKKSLFIQAYTAFLLAQRINFMWNLHETQAPSIQGLITCDSTITWLMDETAYHFEDPVQVAWLYTLAKMLAVLKSKKKPAPEELFDHAWNIRLFLDDCANNMPESTLESDNANNVDYLLKASTIAIYNTKILDSTINLGIFKNPPRGIRARYVEKMVSLFPKSTKLYIPPLNNQIAIKTANAPTSYPLNQHTRKRSNAIIDGDLPSINKP